MFKSRLDKAKRILVKIKNYLECTKEKLDGR